MNYGKSIESYLKKIDSGNPVDFRKFMNLLKTPALNLTFTPSDIQARKVSGTLYYVSCIASSLRGELDKIVAEQASDRVSGAKQNRSHDYSVNGSMLLVREGNIHPTVVMFDTDGNYTPLLKTFTSALLIENRQNFISIDKTIRFIDKYCAMPLGVSENCLAVFTEGNAISNVLHQKFLSQFESIYLLLDVDAGGLQIASNVIALIPSIQIKFLIPTDIKQRLKSIREPAEVKSIEKAIMLGRAHSELTFIAQLIHTTQRELEQESYLDD